MRFTNPANPAEFNARVWHIVRQIPSGRVTTYGQIAVLLTVPAGMSPRDYQAQSPRWVGAAMAACPEGVPWQRVINARGKISLRGGNETHQRALLEAEGVEFDERGRVDLSRFGWPALQENLELSTG